jgi:hypothetical protein
MKGIFSVATLVAVLAALTSAAPTMKERSVGGPVIYTKGADFIRLASEAQPQVDESVALGTTSEAIIARTNGQNEYDSYVSFQIPALASIPGATSSSTCNLVIRNPETVTGSGHTQIFDLGGLITQTGTLTYWQHPYTNQYRGEYIANLGGDSTPIDVYTVPCNFGGYMQYELRPQNDNDYIAWTQDNVNNIGVFVEIRN